MGMKTVQLNRAYLNDKKEEDIFSMYEKYLAKVKEKNNPNVIPKADVSITASNLVVAEMIQKFLNS